VLHKTAEANAIAYRIKVVRPMAGSTDQRVHQSERFFQMTRITTLLPKPDRFAR
jgi:hypothetical protein